MPIINISMEIVCFFVTLILLFCTAIDNNKDTYPNKIFMTMLTINAFLLIEDILAWSFCGNQNIDAFLYINASIGYILGNIVSCLLAHYISASIGTSSKNLKIFTRVMDLICVFASTLVIVSLFNGMYFTYNNGIYARGNMYFVSQALPVLMLGINELFVLGNRKKLGKRYTLSMLSYAILPVAAMIVQYSYLNLEITYVASTLSLLIIHIVVNTEQSRLLSKKEKELTEARIDIMLSQIQPHFLYNALGVIQHLSHGKAPEAESATIEFSEFLRANLDSIKAEKPIAFEKELNHVQNYLSLEKKRFDDMLNVEYDIKTTLFRIPALTLQPIVENAVRYGVTKKPDGGTIKISTKQTDNTIIITVSDDGVGFDINQRKADGRSHIGIDNVKQRLKSMCDGELAIESELNVGTVATITLKKENI